MEHPADVIDFFEPKGRERTPRGDPADLPQPHPLPEGHADFEYEKVTGIQLYSKQALKFYHDTPKIHP